MEPNFLFVDASMEGSKIASYYLTILTAGQLYIYILSNHWILTVRWISSHLAYTTATAPRRARKTSRLYDNSEAPYKTALKNAVLAFVVQPDRL